MIEKKIKKESLTLPQNKNFNNNNQRLVDYILFIF